MATKPRPYLNDDHLWSVIDTEAGAIALKPNNDHAIYFDIAWSSSMPANQPDGEHNSRVLDIGRGVKIRATGHVVQVPDGWTVDHLTAKQYPSGRDLTPQQRVRALETIKALVKEWIATHEGDIAQADDIDRNNGARTLEENIARHEEALRILRENLHRCQEEQTYQRYPDLPTDR